MLVLQAAAIVALVALTVSVVGATRAFSRRSEPVAVPDDHSDIVERLIALEGLGEENNQRFNALTTAVSEGIAGFKRHEKRVQRTVTSARRLIRENGLEHAALEGEFEELRDGDGAPGEEPELPSMPTLVAESYDTGHPGVSPAELQIIRERGRYVG